MRSRGDLWPHGGGERSAGRKTSARIPGSVQWVIQAVRWRQRSGACHRRCSARVSDLSAVDCGV